MKRYNNSRLIGTTAIIGLFALGGQRAEAQRFGPDQLQTLGVGSRAVAMGDAYAAIANDASATFWNPGRLGFLRLRQVMFSYHNVDDSFASQTYTPGLNGAVGTTASGSSFRSGDFQPGFGSFIYPLYNAKRTGVGAASIGVSYTLGGYFNLDRQSNNATLNTDTRTIVSNSFITAAYGAQVAPRLGVGVGVFFLNQDFSKKTVISDPVSQATTSNLAFEKGRGYGVNIGICYDTGGTPSTEKKASAGAASATGSKFLPSYSFALAYRTKAKLSGLGDQGQGFNREIPGRFSAGFAITERVKSDSHIWQIIDKFDQKKSPYPQYGEGTFSIEFQALEAANRSYDSQGNLNLIDARRAVGDLHVGFEYIPGVLHKPSQYEVPLRFGFRTNSNAAFNYSYYDNVVSFGLAYIRLTGQDTFSFSVEPTVEMFTSNGAANYTLTAQLKF